MFYFYVGVNALYVIMERSLMEYFEGGMDTFV